MYAAWPFGSHHKCWVFFGGGGIGNGLEGSWMAMLLIHYIYLQRRCWLSIGRDHICLSFCPVWHHPQEYLHLIITLLSPLMNQNVKALPSSTDVEHVCLYMSCTKSHVESAAQPDFLLPLPTSSTHPNQVTSLPAKLPWKLCSAKHISLPGVCSSYYWECELHEHFKAGRNPLRFYLQLVFQN